MLKRVDGDEICVGQNTRHAGRDMNPEFHKYVKNKVLHTRQSEKLAKI